MLLNIARNIDKTKICRTVCAHFRKIGTLRIEILLKHTLIHQQSAKMTIVLISSAYSTRKPTSLRKPTSPNIISSKEIPGWKQNFWIAKKNQSIWLGNQLTQNMGKDSRQNITKFFHKIIWIAIPHPAKKSENVKLRNNPIMNISIDIEIIWG